MAEVTVNEWKEADQEVISITSGRTELTFTLSEAAQLLTQLPEAIEKYKVARMDHVTNEIKNLNDTLKALKALPTQTTPAKRLTTKTKQNSSFRIKEYEGATLSTHVETEGNGESGAGTEHIGRIRYKKRNACGHARRRTEQLRLLGGCKSLCEREEGRDIIISEICGYPMGTLLPQAKH